MAMIPLWSVFSITHLSPQTDIVSLLTKITTSRILLQRIRESSSNWYLKQSHPSAAAEVNKTKLPTRIFAAVEGRIMTPQKKQKRSRKICLAGYCSSTTIYHDLASNSAFMLCLVIDLIYLVTHLVWMRKERCNRTKE